MGIRIIRSVVLSDSNLYAVEREEAIHLIARQIAEALGTTSLDEIDECARKIRNASSALAGRSAEQVACDVDASIHSNPRAVGAHANLDLDRIMQLLEL